MLKLLSLVKELLPFSTPLVGCEITDNRQANGSVPPSSGGGAHTSARPEIPVGVQRSERYHLQPAAGRYSGERGSEGRSPDH